MPLTYASPMTPSGDAAAAHQPLRVRLLGGFAVEGIEERELGTRKARLLLKRLALALGRAVSADELAFAAWGDDPPQKPGDQVSVLVSRLRRVLGPDRLPRSDAGYSLAADWFDVVELERHVSELEERLRARETGSALAAAHAALALAAGALLPEEDGEWVDEARRTADRLVARARLLSGEAALAVGELDAARAAVQPVLDQDPYDEAALRLVMRADAVAGRPGTALAAYATVRHRLSEDLGVDPAPETEQLHTAIVRGELPTLSGVPSASAAVVGRQTETALLEGLLARSAAEPVGAVIEAEAGMGKTTLLTSWASHASSTALVVSGRCDELGRGLPLQPLVDGLAMHLETLGRQAATELLSSEASVLDPLLGRSRTERLERATTVADAETGRAVMFGALAAVLRRAAGDRPLVLAVDDLHQAAPGTAEFLSFCLHRIRRLMVLAARRPERGPDLPTAQRILLGPLSRLTW